MITYKRHKPDILKPINGKRINYLSFTESSYFLVRLTKIDKKTTTKVLDKKTRCK